MARIEDRVTGWWVFAGTLLAIAGVLNVIWGIAAIGEASFFVANQKFILSTLQTWGWVTLIIGVMQLIAGFSLFSGGGFGRWFGMLAAGLSAIAALLSIAAYPFWSLCIFALAIIILYELAKAPVRAAVA
jgi:hypothetical protein